MIEVFIATLFVLGLSIIAFADAFFGNWIRRHLLAFMLCYASILVALALIPTISIYIAEKWPFIARCLEVSTIFLLAGIGELLDQRSGILNVGIEGLMLLGAASGFITALHTGSLLIGFIAGALMGGIFGFLHGLFSITLKVNQVVSAMGIWLFAIGFVTFWADRYSGPLKISSPRIGGLSPMFFLAVALVFIVWFVLYKSHIGLKIRSVGEDPSVAEATGINVIRIRYQCVVLGGLLGGLAGAFCP